MPDEISALTRRVDANERNHTDLAKSVTAIIEDQREIRDEMSDLKTERAVRVVRDEALNDRLRRIEKSIERVYNLGWWVLGAFGLTLIAAISSFVFKGGLNAP